MLDRLRRERQHTTDPAPLFDEAWELPPTFNFTRDVIDVAARDRFRRGLTSIDRDGTIDRETFADLSRTSSRWANLLRELVPEPGERVVLAIESGTVRMTAVLGAIRYGLIPVPVPFDLTPVDLALRAADVDAALIVASNPSAKEALSLVPEGVTPSFASLEDLTFQLMRPEVGGDGADVPVTTPALIVFTRGREGSPPKPVVHSHAATAVAGVPLAYWLGVRPGDLVYTGAEAAPAASLWNGMFGPWAAGAEILEIGRGVPWDERVDLLERFAPTIVIQTPEEHRLLLDELARSGRTMPRLRVAGSTGDRLEPALSTRFERELGVRLLDAYGMAETGTIIAQTVNATDPVGSLGRPVPGLRMRPAASDGGPIEQGEPGPLALYGHPPSLFLGYWPRHWNLIDDASEVDLRDEAWWVPTDDRFSADASGALTLVTPPPRRTRRRRSAAGPPLEAEPRPSALPPRRSTI